MQKAPYWDLSNFLTSYPWNNAILAQRTSLFKFCLPSEVPPLRDEAGLNRSDPINHHLNHFFFFAGKLMIRAGDDGAFIFS